MIDPLFFATPAAFRAWLAEHHDTSVELWVGFYKKDAGRPSITWPEAVDEALCFGWIDGLRKSIDAVSYANRFTPRKPRSTWSALNIRRVQELTSLGRMQPAGLRAFAARAEARSGIYAYEQRAPAALTAAEEAEFQANPAAWGFFTRQPAGYRKTAVWWVISAKKDETRRKRLLTLIADSAECRTIRPLTRPAPRSTEETQERG